MAIFRGITAEEEAATGLMHCLKEKNFKNADMLKLRNHVYKNSVSQFIRILSLFYNEFFNHTKIKPVIHINNESGEKRLAILIPIAVNGEVLSASLVPPLNFCISVESQAPSYRKQIDEYMQVKGIKDIATYLKNLANFRNEILYAGPNGYPKVPQVPPEFLHAKTNNVLILLRAYLMIFPYSEIQPFVQDSLDAYLAMLGALKDNELHNEV